MAKGHKKNTKVKFKNSNKSISEAKAEGFDVEFVITHLFEAMKKKEK